MKSEWVKGIFFWFAVVLLGGLILFQVSRRQNLGLSGIPVDPKPAPNFTLQGISLDQFKGQRVLLHFWATWCEPCREEMPHLITLGERLKGQLVILAVAVDSNKHDVAAFFGDQKPPFQILIDSQHQVASLYGISQFPETLLIGPDGQVQTLYVGPQNWDLF